ERINARDMKSERRCSTTVEIAGRIDIRSPVEEQLHNFGGIFGNTLPRLFDSIRAAVVEKRRAMRSGGAGVHKGRLFVEKLTQGFDIAENDRVSRALKQQVHFCALELQNVVSCFRTSLK